MKTKDSKQKLQRLITLLIHDWSMLDSISPNWLFRLFLFAILTVAEFKPVCIHQSVFLRQHPTWQK